MDTIYFISEDGEGYASLDGVQSEGDWANVFSKMAGCGFVRATKEEYKKRVRKVRKLEKLGASVGTLKIDAIPDAKAEEAGDSVATARGRWTAGKSPAWIGTEEAGHTINMTCNCPRCNPLSPDVFYQDEPEEAGGE